MVTLIYILNSPGNLKININIRSGPRGLQLQVFKTEVDQQQLIPTLRSYLKLYTTLPIAKLAKFLDMKENEVRCCLMAFKHKKEIVSATSNNNKIIRAKNKVEKKSF